MRRRRYPCWVWGPVIALPLLLLAAWVPGKQIVDGALERKARTVLKAAALDGVSADFDWGRGVLTGPADNEAEALALVGLAISKDKRYGLRYVSNGEAPATTTTVAAATTVAASTSAAAATTAAPTTVARTTVATTGAPTTVSAATVSVDAASDVSGNQIVLRGKVANAAQRTTIVDAATAAFGPSRLVDQLTVAGGTSSAAVDEAVKRYATVLGAIAPRLSAGSAAIKETTITVTGTGFNPTAVDGLKSAVQAANGAGVTATGTFDVAAADAKQLAAQLTALLGRSGINFAPDSADIDAPSRVVVDTAAASIVALPTVKISVEGHTDSDGPAAANQTLSQRRAEAVVAYLVSKGVSAAQLTAQGFGATRPIADNSTPEGRATNRRIEFVVTGS